MSNLPLKSVSGVAAIASLALVRYQPDLLLFSKPSYVGTFLQIWVLELCLLAFYKVILYPKYLSPLRGLPEPEGGSFWNGHFKQISALPSGVPMIGWLNNVPNDGIIRYLGVLNSERVIVTSPKALSEVLTTRSYDFAKPYHLRASIGRILGVGILLAEGDEHKTQRRNLLPAFAFRHVKNLYAGFWEKAREGVDAMTQHINAGGIKYENLPDFQKDCGPRHGAAILEVGEWASRITLDIIGVAGMGHDFGAIQDPNTDLNIAYQRVFKPSRQAQVMGLFGLLLPHWFVARLPVKRNEDINVSAAIIRSTCRQLIKEKKEKLVKHQLADVDILSVALESGGFSDESLIDQLMTFLAAGHETTATAMTWAVYMLCRYPEMQKRLRAEVREHLPSPNDVDSVSSQEIDHMPYLNAVCNEVLRYYPPVSLTLRIAARDTCILNTPIPKGTQVMLIPLAVNKNDALWGPDASKFNPDRWMPSEKTTHSATGGAASNYSFLTFLHGPRSCIGQGFAKAEFACLLAAWIGRFEFELNDKREMDEDNVLIKGGITARPAKGMYVRTKVVPGW